MAMEVFMMMRSSPFPLLPSSPVTPSSLNKFASPFLGLRLSFTNKVNLQRNTYLIGLHSRNSLKGKMVIKCNYPQNSDLPRRYSRREKKPFPVPILELRRNARERIKKMKGKRIHLYPPKNGLLVLKLIPLAYEVINARVTLINCLKRLLRVVPVQACRYCPEIHVGPTGHPFRNCNGVHSNRRYGAHDWARTYSFEDIFPLMECFHLADRLGPRILHQERFSLPRIPALIELCIQAGVDVPGLYVKRRRKPVIRIGRKEIIDSNEDDLPDPEPVKNKIPLLEIIPDEEIMDLPLLSGEEVVESAREAMRAWEKVREGAERLMKKYAVRVCGYCPELHVGPTGHKAQNCGAHKHQQRNGQHGWQSAVIEDLVPGRYVWHVPEGDEELKRELRSFYGQAPAVVEICVRAGADVPERYRGTMRLDVGIPESAEEADMVV